MEYNIRLLMQKVSHFVGWLAIRVAIEVDALYRFVIPTREPKYKISLLRIFACMIVLSSILFGLILLADYRGDDLLGIIGSVVCGGVAAVSVLFFAELIIILLCWVIFGLIQLPQKFFNACIGIHNETDERIPELLYLYTIDTTQKHYPRIRVQWCTVYTGTTSKGLLECFLPIEDANTVPHQNDMPDIEEVPGNHCICSFIMRLHPQDVIHSFVVYFCECREGDAFYELCSAFDVPENIRVKIATNNSSMIIRCFDVLHRVYHRNNELTLATIKTKLSEYSDEVKQIVSEYYVADE